MQAATKKPPTLQALNEIRNATRLQNENTVRLKMWYKGSSNKENNCNCKHGTSELRI